MRGKDKHWTAVKSLSLKSRGFKQVKERVPLTAAQKVEIGRLEIMAHGVPGALAPVRQARAAFFEHCKGKERQVTASNANGVLRAITVAHRRHSSTTQPPSLVS